MRSCGARAPTPPSAGKEPLKPTDIREPDYFHKVVDCQWACPAHTPVPEYIRLIAAGRYTDAYMVNWESNVFPGILGRTCDRPCEPACRRGRVEEAQAEKPEPVAICRLKRVTADYKDDIGKPAAAHRGAKNGKRIACVGAGPGVADGRARPRAARLRGDGLRRRRQGRRHDALADPALSPARGGDRRRDRLRHAARRRVPWRHAHRIDEAAARREAGTRSSSARGAPRGRDLSIPGRKEAAAQHPHRHRLAVVGLVRPRRRRSAKRVIVLGGGNTAMDCCRSSQAARRRATSR